VEQRMKGRKIVLWATAFLFLFLPVALPGQTNCEEGAGTLNRVPLQGLTAEDIIRKFAAKESTFKAARQKYTYTQDVKVQTLRAMGNQISVDGEFRQVMEVAYDENGKRQEHVTFAPQSILRRVALTPEDLEDIRDYMSFALTGGELPQYDVLYTGQQKVDELQTYVFEVAPKKIEKGKRYFQGRVWVETGDTVVVKTCGKSVPDRVATGSKNRAQENVQPLFVTYREQIDGQYCFPTYTRSDDFLTFSRQTVRIREIIKYTGYKQSTNPAAGRSEALTDQKPKP
jgi:hypothetical protein